MVVLQNISADDKIRFCFNTLCQMMWNMNGNLFYTGDNIYIYIYIYIQRNENYYIHHIFCLNTV